jgi:hypothetical protein
VSSSKLSFPVAPFQICADVSPPCGSTSGVSPATLGLGICSEPSDLDPSVRDRSLIGGVSSDPVRPI